MKRFLLIFVFLFTYFLSFSQNYILVNYNISSNKKRMFIIINNKIVNKFMVCSGKTDVNNKVIFSNLVDSNCSSKGKIKIGNSYYGTYGKAYKLHGLEKTNSNIFKRFVVLHSHSCVPQNETSYYICNSMGCLTVNPKDFETIENYIKKYKIKTILVQ